MNRLRGLLFWRKTGPSPAAPVAQELRAAVASNALAASNEQAHLAALIRVFEELKAEAARRK